VSAVLSAVLASPAYRTSKDTIKMDMNVVYLSIVVSLAVGGQYEGFPGKNTGITTRKGFIGERRHNRSTRGTLAYY